MSVVSVLTENSSFYQQKGSAYGSRKIQIFPSVLLTFSFENLVLRYKHGYAQRGFCNASTHVSAAIHSHRQTP